MLFSMVLFLLFAHHGIISQMNFLHEMDAQVIYMKIAALQMDIIENDREANVVTMCRMMAEAAESRPDMIVLPELWDVGFYPEDVTAAADPDGKYARTLLSELAAKYQVNIVGGSIANLIGRYAYNTSYVFDRTGHLLSTYHKTHLFGGEADTFAAGDSMVMYELDGVRCATIICYDVRFPEMVRTLAVSGVKILFVPAAWPVQRMLHWETLTRARAIENQMFVVAVNGIGSFSDGITLGGMSRVIDPWGEVLSSASNERGIITANLRPGILEEIRSSIHIYDDRRPEIYSRQIRHDGLSVADR